MPLNVTVNDTKEYQQLVQVLLDYVDSKHLPCSDPRRVSFWKVFDYLEALKHLKVVVE